MIAILCLFFETYARPCYFLAVSHPNAAKLILSQERNKYLNKN